MFRVQALASHGRLWTPANGSDQPTDRIRRLGVRISSGALSNWRPIVPGLGEVESHLRDLDGADDLPKVILPTPPQADVKHMLGPAELVAVRYHFALFLRREHGDCQETDHRRGGKLDFPGSP